MSFGERVKESLISNAANGLAVSFSGILIWMCTQIGPILAKALSDNASPSLLLTLLLGSLAFNIVFLIVFWVTRNNNDMTLKYGIYWDSKCNPHCPNCKIPIGGYSDGYTSGAGYYCKPCGKVFPLSDAHGNDINPEVALKELTGNV